MHVKVNILSVNGSTLKWNPFNQGQQLSASDWPLEVLLNTENIKGIVASETVDQVVIMYDLPLQKMANRSLDANSTFYNISDSGRTLLSFETDSFEDVDTALAAINSDNEGGAGQFDTITESTANTGTTIEGFKLKDGYHEAKVLVKSAAASVTVVDEDVVQVQDATNSVILPAAIAGRRILVQNQTNSSVIVSRSGSNHISVATSSNTNTNSVAVAGYNSVLFECITTGEWIEFSNRFDTLETDYITEKTSGSGTQINGTTIKDGKLSQSVATGLTAAGTVIGDALDLTAAINVVATAAASTGVQLPDCVNGSVITVYNDGANTINVFPHSGSAAIDAGSAGAAETIASGNYASFVKISSTLWKTL